MVQLAAQAVAREKTCTLETDPSQAQGKRVRHTAWYGCSSPRVGVQMRTSLRSLILVIVLVTAATAAFYVTYGNSVLQWVFLFPLLPGAMTGLYLSGHGGITLIALIVSLTVNTGLYLLIWLVVLRVIRRFRKTDGQ